jgi:hypothetical protein
MSAYESRGYRVNLSLLPRVVVHPDQLSPLAYTSWTWRVACEMSCCLELDISGVVIGEVSRVKSRQVGQSCNCRVAAWTHVLGRCWGG